jgi:hypothetical protein
MVVLLCRLEAFSVSKVLLICEPYYAETKIR